MRGFLYFIFLVFLLISGCITTTEKYRYQQRVDNFYHLLKDEEWALFKTAEFDRAGDMIKKRLSEDTNFFKKWKKMQYDEAIATFDPAQTLKFFYEIIYKELNRTAYYKLMNMMDEKSLMKFIRYEDFENLGDEFYKSSSRAKAFIENLKKGYRLYKFSNKEIFELYRKVIFREATQKYFYDLCKLLDSLKLLNDFENGNLERFSSLKLDNLTEMEFQRIQQLTGLKLNFSEFVKVYYDVVIKEMDRGAVIQTLHKF
ncbi:MAG: hypothetical protein ACP5QT_07590 [Brevinematia bacterium]